MWVGGKAEQIKRILKSSWQLNKTAPKAVCHGMVFKHWPPLSVSGFVRVLVSRRLSSPFPASPIGACVITTDTKRRKQT